MTINIAKPVRHTTDPDLLGGPNGLTDDLLLISGGTDKFLMSGNDDILLQATGDEILISGGTDSLLIGGNFIIRGS